MGSLQIVFPADFNYVPGVRVCISRICNEKGFNEHEVYQIETVIDELCNNAIEHGSKSDKDGITVECNIEDGDLKVSIKDTGNKQFIIEEVFSLNKKRRELGWEDGEMYKRGRGLFIVQKMIDELFVSTGETGTSVRIHKQHKEQLDGNNFVFPKYENEAIGS